MKTTLQIVAALVAGVAIGAGGMWATPSGPATVDPRSTAGEAYLKELRDGPLTDRLEFMQREFGDARTGQHRGPVYDDFRAVTISEAISAVRTHPNVDR